MDGKENFCYFARHSAWLPSQMPGAYHSRVAMPLGSEMLEEEPVYVNAKQYHRIMIRRQTRQKLEQSNKLPRQRKVRCHSYR